MKAKEYLTEKVTPFLKNMKAMTKNVKIIRCDNSCETKTLKENCAKNFEEIKFEFKSTGTPQQNGVVEEVFATIYSQTRMMIVHVPMD